MRCQACQVEFEAPDGRDVVDLVSFYEYRCRRCAEEFIVLDLIDCLIDQLKRPRTRQQRRQAEERTVRNG